MPEMTKPPKDFSNGGSALWISLAVTYFHWKYNQLSSALKRFTVLFGMGRSGTTSVWPPGKGFDLLTSVSSSNSLAKEAKLRARNHIFFELKSFSSLLRVLQTSSSTVIGSSLTSN